jgi:hypothetical protein
VNATPFHHVNIAKSKRAECLEAANVVHANFIDLESILCTVSDDCETTSAVHIL